MIRFTPRTWLRFAVAGLLGYSGVLVLEALLLLIGELR